jgi:hypothetical protein
VENFSHLMINPRKSEGFSEIYVVRTPEEANALADVFALPSK